MLYFIPAWYQQNEWSENEQKWYVRRMHTEFDDTVKQIQMFQRNQVYPYQIMLLSFAPNFRHFLHRQSVYHAPYWSCFDAIQEVRRKRIRMLSYHDLNWPEHIEFIFSPFALIARLEGEKYAQVEFGEDGNPIQVDMYENGRLKRRNIYDDRGFVAATTLFEEERPVYQDYLTEKGVRKLRRFFADGHIEVNPKAPNYLIDHDGKEESIPFARSTYESLDQVIREVLIAYVSRTGTEDVFCVAMDQHHALLLKEALQHRKMILSFFEDRYELKSHPETMDMIQEADYIITDSRENRQAVRRAVGQSLQNIADITPFDSRVDFGISQQLYVQKILVPVDGMSESTFAELIRKLGEYLPQNENAQVHLFTRQADYNRKSKLLEQTRRCLRAAGMDEEWAAEEPENNGSINVAENDLEEEQTPIRFYAEQCVDELSVSKCMREQRLIVDMRDTTELYLRITALSMGIPQIVYRRTQYVEDEENGFVLKDLERLPEAMHYYLGSLTNWNEAMIYSYELGKNYTTKVLLEKWKEVIEFVGRNSHTGDGHGGLE